MNVEVSVIGLPLGGRPSTGQSVAQETDRRWFAELPEGATIQHLIEHLGLPEDEIQLMLVNGHCTGPGVVLHDGDAVAFTGQVSGD